MYTDDNIVTLSLLNVVLEYVVRFTYNAAITPPVNILVCNNSNTTLTPEHKFLTESSKHYYKPKICK